MPSGQVFLRDSKGCLTEIKKLNADEPNKGLGVHLAASGSMETEHRFRLQQCREAAGKAHTSNLTHRKATSMLNGCIVPQVTYSMPVTTFNADQCSS